MAGRGRSAILGHEQKCSSSPALLTMGRISDQLKADLDAMMARHEEQVKKLEESRQRCFEALRELKKCNDALLDEF